MDPGGPPFDPWVRIIQLEALLAAETRQKNEAVAAKDATVALLNDTIVEKVIAVERERFAIEKKVIAVERERFAIERERVAIEKKDEAIERERVAIERERAAVDNARYLVYYGIRQNEKLEIMHERLHQSHGRSIENPVARSKRPVVALLPNRRSKRRLEVIDLTETPKKMKRTIRHR